jgi:hypothetical protein
MADVKLTSAMFDNGNAPTFDEDRVIAMVEQELERCDSEHGQLLMRANMLRKQMTRYRRMLAILRDESPKPKPKQNMDPRAREKRASKLGYDKLDEIRSATLAYASEHDEFSQVDIRATTGYGSSVMATAFERLRQEGVIRFARKEGTRKWFRLTQDAINRQADDAEV